MHRVKSGESLWSISRRYGMTVQQLARMNHISSKSLLKPGQRLQVAGTGGSAQSASASTETTKVAATAGKVNYKVKRGDTLSGIARRFAVSVRDLQAWNNMGGSTALRAGQLLTIHVGGRQASAVEFGGREGMGFLAGKKALIVGLATDRSIAWGISQAMSREGAELAFTYQNDRIKEPRGRARRRTRLDARDADGRRHSTPRSKPRSSSCAARGLRSTSSSTRSHSRRARRSPADSSRRRPARTSPRARRVELQPDGAREGRACRSWRAARARILTLSYLGAVRSIPAYNVMGLAKASLEANVRFLAADLGAKNIRVNAISAGPIKTLAAAGIPGFRQDAAPRRAGIAAQAQRTIEDVGNAAAFLCSDLAAGITGETLYVDAGYSHVGHELPGVTPLRVAPTRGIRRGLARTRPEH